MRFLSVVPIFLCQLGVDIIYWCEIPIENKKVFLPFYFGLACVLWGGAYVVYFFIWTGHLGLYPPLPFSGAVGTLGPSLLALIAIWFG